MFKNDLLKINDPKGELPNSFYKYSINKKIKYPTLTKDTISQICIIGAGFTGLSAGLCLAELGFEVIILEANRVGFGASGRNGGQVGSGQRWDQEKLEKYFGFHKAKIFWEISQDAKQDVISRIKLYNIDCDFSPGIINTTINKYDTLELVNEVNNLKNKYKYTKIQKLTSSELSNIIETDIYDGGCLDLGAGHLNPLKFVQGLGIAAKKNKAQIFEKSHVKKIDYGNKNTLFLSNGYKVICDYLIIACNGYLGNLEPHISSRVMPINNFIVTTEVLGNNLLNSFLKNNYAVADNKFVPNYFRPSPDKRLIFGGGENYTYRFPKDIKKMVRKKMTKVYPQLNNTKIDFAWGGTLAVTRNRLPYFAKIKPNVFSASGYSGHGVALSVLSGRIIAELIKGDSKRFDFMYEIPTKSFPGNSSFQWPLLVLGMLWYSLRDRFK
ncbi:MAG: NAD(P)/FAD-dependent oxidoreductase [Paracoccaceae bacterium]